MSDQRPQESSSNHSCLSQHTCTHAIMSPGTLYHGANGFTLDDRYKSPQMSPNLKRPRLDSNTAKLELSCYQLNIEGIHNMQRHHAGMSVICMNWIALCFQNMGAWWCLCMFLPQKETVLNSNSKVDRIWKNGQLMTATGPAESCRVSCAMGWMIKVRVNHSMRVQPAMWCSMHRTKNEGIISVIQCTLIFQFLHNFLWNFIIFISLHIFAFELPLVQDLTLVQYV